MICSLVQIAHLDARTWHTLLGVGRNHSITPFATTSRQRSHTTCPLRLGSDAKPSTLRGHVSHRKNCEGIVQTDYPEKGSGARSLYGMYSLKTYAQDIAPCFSWLVFHAKSRRKIGNRSEENARKAAVAPIIQTLSSAARRLDSGPPLALPGRPPARPELVEGLRLRGPSKAPSHVIPRQARCSLRQFEIACGCEPNEAAFMESGRVRCSADGCDHTILPETAQRTGGLCMRCVQKRAAAERQEYVRKNRRTVNLYEGITDSVNLIIVHYTPRKHDPLIVYTPCPYSAEQLFAKLTPHEASELEQRAVAEKQNGQSELADEIAGGLAVFTLYPIQAIQTTWLDLEQFRPAVIFRGAPSTVRDRLVQQLEEGHNGPKRTLEVNDRLCALAWIGDELVADTFARWEAEPPIWRKSLYVGPGAYAQTAGWELGGRTRRNLYFPNSFVIDLGGSGIGAFPVFQKLDQRCPWCGQQLVNLLSLPPSLTEQLFIESTACDLPVLTCASCTCYGEHLFARVSEDGNATLHEKNKGPSIVTNAGESPANPWEGVPIQLACAQTPIAPNPGQVKHCSRLGGIPSWVQDSAFPTCPDCATTMKFLAQLDNETFPHFEGIYYAFVCLECRTTATCYQQT